ncbi:MAG: hypothetical protein JSW05_04045 [Candidatus Thorarchaeota archaeon]|nr:MAG: hypothetical protein JSW05_04045 [Candidatus Thorarchaeota archaeon]
MASNNQIRLLCFGDSLTAGTPGRDPMFGGREEFQYAYWLVKLAESEGRQSVIFTNHGVPGDLAKSMPRRLSRALSSEKYDFAIILAGSNDLGWDYTPASVFSSLRELWSITFRADIRTVACTIPPIGMDYPPIQTGQRELNRMILDETDARQDLVCADVFSALADENGLLPKKYDSGDGLHLNIEGYRCLGETIWLNGLKQLLVK